MPSEGSRWKGMPASCKRETDSETVFYLLRSKARWNCHDEKPWGVLPFKSAMLIPNCMSLVFSTLCHIIW